jgi:hypothetical protein
MSDDGTLYVYLPFDDRFVRKYSAIFHRYMNKECFMKDLERLEPSKDEEYLFFSGKKVQGKGDFDFEYNKKHYKVTCMMTVTVKKTYNELWNVCTPISQRMQGYLGKLLDFYETEMKKKTRLYVDLDKPYLLEVYKKFGFMKKAKPNKYGYIMEKNI